MPRKLLKRIMPDQKTMREHPHLQKFGRRLTDPKLWHLNRRSAAGGLAVGLFVAFVPSLGQMIIAAALAILLRVNLPLSVMAVWVTNPITMGPIYFFSYKLGAWVMDLPVSDHAFNLSWQWFSNEFLTIWQPLLLGCFICGVIAALLAIIVVRIAWRIIVIRSWTSRSNKLK